jgi:DNA processing protein
MKSNTNLTDKQKYLQIIKSIDKSVDKLYSVGVLPEERLPSVAIVGSRKPTAYGKTVAYRLAQELSAQGVVIVSGMALGIDGIAHRAALEANGKTVAVLGGGLGEIYPSRHRQLAEDIVSSGNAVISEYPDTMPPIGHQFLARNRIISGLSDVVIVVEAASRSGTLSTARWALEQGKTLMAVPGNITAPLSAGCNQLIKIGAAPVTDTKDILAELGLNTGTNKKSMPKPANKQEEVVLKLIKNGVSDGEEIQAKSGLDASLFNQTLTILEITGKVRPLGANQWTLG